MKVIDIGAILTGYNFVIGVLLMLASSKAGELAGRVNRANSLQIGRYVDISVFTFGAAVAALSGSIYLFLYILKIEI
jgi:hypothetical protein